MKFKTTLLALTLALFPVISSAMSQAEEDRILKQAMKMHKQGNITRAIQLYRQVSTHPAAQNNLGSIYFEQGKYKEALVWLRKATTPPHRVTYANNMLDIMYFEGNGVKQNFDKAKQHFSEACKYKLQDGCDNLQKLNKLKEQYSHEKTMQALEAFNYFPENHNKAVKLAEQGKYKEAIKIFKDLANRGYPHSQNNLAIMYYLGKGVTKNKDIAKKWFKKACDGGSQEACETLKNYH